MNKRIQKRGHCPICGRIQAVNGGMAKHGYDVENGYFNGVCHGAGKDPIEIERGVALHQARHLKIAAEGFRGEAFKIPVEIKDFRGRVIAWDSMSLRDQQNVELKFERDKEHKARAYDDMADYLRKLVDEKHGQRLIEIEIDADAKAIKVGEKVKIFGKVVEVIEIKDAQARGVGPSVNGKWMDHIYWLDDNGQKRGYPKRYARKIPA